MKVKPAFIFCAVMMVIFGLLFVIIPTIALSLFDISLSAEGNAMVRLFGASLIGYAVMLWLAKGDIPSEARRHMILGETTHSAIATVIIIISMIQGIGNYLVAIPLIVHLVCAVWFGYLYGKGAK
jgi:hypothetical protein